MGKNLHGKELGKGIRQRKNGLYDARAAINGYKIHLSDTNLKKLRQEFNLKKKELEKGNKVIVKNYTLNEWFEIWLNKYKIAQVKKSSIIPIKSKYENLFGVYIGNKNIKEIINMDIQNVVNKHIKDNRNTNMIRSSLKNLSEYFDIAIANKIIKENPCILITTPKTISKTKAKNYKLSFLTKEEEEEFLQAAQYKRGKLYGDWLYEVFYVLFYTGLRVSELCGLKWEDINFQKKYINVERQLICQYYKGKHLYFQPPKTSTGFRKIPFIGDIERILKQQYMKISNRRLQLGDKWGSQEDEFADLVFYSLRGTPLTKDTVEKNINYIVNRINKNRMPYDKFKNVHPHMFRHSFASKCYENNIDIKTTQMLLGHSDFATTWTKKVLCSACSRVYGKLFVKRYFYE